jgi:hypothetical protein
MVLAQDQSRQKGHTLSAIAGSAMRSSALVLLNSVHPSDCCLLLLLKPPPCGLETR